MGGYVSLPVTWAARSAGAAVVLHEQNIVLGLAHRVSKRRAATVAVSFEETLAARRHRRVFSPATRVAQDLVRLDRVEARRKAIETFELDPARDRSPGVRGEPGSGSASTRPPPGWRSYGAIGTDVQVLHISGPDAHDAIRERVEEAGGGGLIYRPIPYVSDMGLAYAVADLALCRGGATTVAELGVTGVPSIIVPYPYHRDRQQERHGRVLEKAGRRGRSPG